ATPATAAAGWIENLRVNIDENFEQTAGYIGSVLERPAFDALRYFFNRELDHHAPLLHRRRAGGYVIEGHGDLRLDHVHITDDRVAILDCIEFNERFRMLDIANDVAFLAMDLDVAGRPDLGHRFTEGMADGLADPGLLTLQPFYKAYRAHVRAKVEAIRAGEEEVPDADRQASRQLARRHAQWALRYAISGNEPLVIAVMGRPATGKSTQAAAVAEALGWAHVASDRTRKQLADVDLDVRADAETREQLYTDTLSEKTYATLRERAVERGRAGKGTVLDATYSSRHERDQLRTALKAAGLPYAFVELTASDEALRNRLAARSDAAPTASDARIEDFDKLTDRYEAPNALEDARYVRISAEQPAADSTRSILQTLIRLQHGA
ncbi:MAG: AAA family ATPase, partial [Bacteroidetes bacterium]|nr:AAA family ATPase [Bacteroidota bacterium]